MSNASTTKTPSPVRFTIAAAAVAATASFAVTLGGLPVWALFVGWVAWVLRPGQGPRSMACLGAGLLLAIAAQASIGLLSPFVGPVAIPITVFAVGLVVVGLRANPVLGNPSAWFLGLVSSFALHAENAVEGLVTLVPAMVVGAVGAVVCKRVNDLRVIGGS